jgi:hypothetical protein
MDPELHRQIVEAVGAGAELDAIEDALIEPARLDEEEKAPLWLDAEALQPQGPALLGS